MHDKLVKQLRNTEHCGGCPYDKDCNEFDSCLMDLLAADAIEDMSKRIARQEKKLQEKYGELIIEKIESLKVDFKETMGNHMYMNYKHLEYFLNKLIEYIHNVKIEDVE